MSTTRRCRAVQWTTGERCKARALVVVAPGVRACLRHAKIARRSGHLHAVIASDDAAETGGTGSNTTMTVPVTKDEAEVV